MSEPLRVSGAWDSKVINRFLPLGEDLYWWQGDTCNVYVMRDGTAGALIDIGSGDVLEALGAIGIERVERVYLTQHHREHSSGIERLRDDATLVVSTGERELLTHPERFVTEEIAPSAFTVGGASYVRPPRLGARLQVEVAHDAQLLTWRSHTLEAYETPGASPAGMTYVWSRDGERTGFCGNLCLDGGRLFRLFDSEWDYGYAAGLNALLASQNLLRGLGLDRICPGQGDVITNPDSTLTLATNRLHGLIRVLLRDYTPLDDAVVNVSRPTATPGLRRVSPHLFTLRTAKRHNAYVLLSEDGHALFIDCGLFLRGGEDTAFLDDSIGAMKRDYGLRAVDAVIVTHYHGDHVRQIPHLVDRHGAEVWAYANFSDILENPWAYNLTWMLPAYRGEHARVAVDRVLHDAEKVEWRGLSLEVFHAPGQTEFAQGIVVEVDGRKVAFTGDNLFFSAEGSGHDAYSMYNSGGVMERGYLATARSLLAHCPDLVLGGHGQEIPKPKRQLRALYAWSLDVRRRLVDLTWGEAYEMGVDPFWARFHPYRSWLAPGEEAVIDLHVRNYYSDARWISGKLRVPPDWSVRSRPSERLVEAGESATFVYEVRAAATFVEPVLLTADLSVGDRRMGEFPQAYIFPRADNIPQS